MTHVTAEICRLKEDTRLVNDYRIDTHADLAAALVGGDDSDV